MRSTIHIAMAVVVLASCAPRSTPPQAGGRAGSGDARLIAGGTGAARTGHAAALLGDGRVLLAGGTGTGASELFDPSSGQFAPTGALGQTRTGATATVLLDGRVLVVGGDAFGTADLYDPVTGVFSPAAPLPGPRAYHTATRLPGGHVIVVGGTDGGAALDTVLEFDPGASTSAGSWTTFTTTLLAARSHHTTTLLPVGDLLVAGGETAPGAPVAATTAERYTPAGAGATAAVAGLDARSRHAACRLTSGQVLVAGGADGSGPLGSTALFDGTSFAATADGITPRSELTASLLPDGRVVVAGGRAGATALDDVDVFTAAGALASSAGHLALARGGHAATVLPSGRVLLSGGGLGTVEVLDRAQDRWQTITPTNYDARYGHTATLLPSGAVGQVLVVGGRVGSTGYLRGSQLWNPAAPATLPAPLQLANVRAYHTATVLRDGTVLVTGGNAGDASRQDAELYDGSSWSTVAAPMMAPRSSHTATLLPDGRVLLTGGIVNARPPASVLDSAELYDPSNQTFGWTANNMSAARAHHVATLLRDGRVLVAGGDGVATADIFDPANNSFTPVGNLRSVRGHFTANPLADGRVLFTGGAVGGVEQGTAELFSGGFADLLGAGPAARFDHAAALLPAGEPLIVGGEDAGGFMAGVERYEPSAEAFLSTLVTPLDEGRSQLTATQLPAGEILAWGGDNGGLGVYPAIYDAFVLSGPRPNLGGVPSAAVPTQTLHLTAATGSFTGVTGVDQPIFVLTRQDGDGIVYARAADFTASTATVVLPAVAPAGWWWIRAIVGGVPGTAVPFKMLAPLRLAPLAPTVPPRGSLIFTAWGASSSGFTWSLTASGSASPETPGQPSIDAAGVYVAGATPDSVDTVQVADSLEASVTLTTDVTVGPGITVSPAGPWAAAPRGAISFSATGGCDPAVTYAALVVGCTGYTWSFVTNRSGGSLSPTGAYVAGDLGGVDDELQVVDNLGNHAEVTVTVTTPIVIDPVTAGTWPLGTVGFTVSGGYATGGYTWTVSTNLSGGSVAATGAAAATYTAGRTGSVTDVVRVTDTLGSYAEATITLSEGVSITPAAPSTPPRGSLDFSAAGGNGTFTGCAGATGCWSVLQNRSGGTIDAAGHYTAGATPSVTDVVQVQDTIGNLATVEVTVGPGIRIRPIDPGAYPGQDVTLTATGGSGSGFTWQLTTVNSDGGVIVAGATDGTAVYTAGTRRGTLDVVLVTDDLGNTATTDVAVWPDWKPAGSGCSSSGGGGGALGLLLVALFLVLRAPRTARRAGTALVLLLAAAGARAQVPPVSQSFVVERFQPAGGAYDVLGVQSAQTAGRMQKTFRLYLNYASRPLVLTAPGMDKVALLESQLAADLTGSLGVTDWAEVSLAIPFMVSQRREQDRFLPPELRRSVAKSGLSDVRITPKVRLLDWRKLRLGVAAPVALPVGNKKAFLGHGAFTFAPTALIELDALGPARVLLNAGAVFRPERRLVDLTVGNAYTFGAGFEYPFQVGDSRLAAVATFAGESGMKSSAASRPMELLAGARWRSQSGLEVGAGGGPGIGKGYGTPRYRVFLEIGWTTAGLDRLAESPRQEEEAKPEEPTAEESKPEPEQPKAEEPKPEPEQPRVEEPKPEEPAAEEPAPRPELDVTLRIDAHVYFDFNRKDLKEEYKPLLRRLAKRILAEPRMRVIRIEGHADDLGPPDYNLWLSEERARSVKDFLERCGVPKTRFAVIGFGKTKPTKPGRNADARAKNRRVEFSVQEY